MPLTATPAPIMIVHATSAVARTSNHHRSNDMINLGKISTETKSDKEFPPQESSVILTSPL
jgi:hypothetical protein